LGSKEGASADCDFSARFETGQSDAQSKKPEFIPQPDELRGAQDLAAKRHHHELQPRAEVILSLDAKMSGLGNGSCGPGVLAKYAVPPTNYSLSLRLSPVTR
jgi:hypothetical protein